MSLSQRIFILVLAFCQYGELQMINRDVPVLIMKNVFDRQSDIMRLLRGLEMQMNATREALEAEINATREGLADRMSEMETTLDSSQQTADASTTRLLDSLQQLNVNWTNNQLPQLETLTEVEKKVAGVNDGVNGLKDRINHMESSLKSSHQSLSSEIKTTITEAVSKIKGLTGRVYCITEDDTLPPLTSRCYLFSDHAMSWGDAKLYCQKHGGYLTKISSDDEFNIIRDNISDYAWIGLTDITVEGEFKWTVDGLPHNITRNQHWWGDGEPNNSGNEDCIEFHRTTKKLNDQSCTVSRRFICEFVGVTLD